MGIDLLLASVFAGSLNSVPRSILVFKGGSEMCGESLAGERDDFPQHSLLHSHLLSFWTYLFLPVLWFSKEETYCALVDIFWIFRLHHQKYPGLVLLFSILWHSPEVRYMEGALGLSICLPLNKLQLFPGAPFFIGISSVSYPFLLESSDLTIIVPCFCYFQVGL